MDPALRNPLELGDRTSRALCQRSSGSLREARGRCRSSAGGVTGCSSRDRARLGREDRRHHARRRLALERLLAGEQLVEHAAEREDVGARVGLAAFDLLRRHVLRRAEDHVRAGERLGRSDRRSRWTPWRSPTPPQPARASFARPKSSSLTPALVSRMLAGFRSRWTMPLRCAASSASQICARVLQRLVERQRALRAASPSTYSITR